MNVCKQFFTENIPLKLLTVVAIIIVCVDLKVLKQTFEEDFKLKNYLDQEIY